MSRTERSRYVGLALAFGIFAALSVQAAAPALVGAAPTVTPGAGNKGTDVLPLVTQQIVSYPNANAVRVRFDPASTYVPAAPAGQTYLYQGVWSFDDGTAAFLVPGAPTANPGQALQAIEATFTYTGTAGQPVDTFVVVFRLNITAQGPNGTSPGPSGFVNLNVSVAPTNNFPEASIVQIGSASAGILPYTVTVTPSATFDIDGFIAWAAIDWGDGTAERITSPLPSSPAVPITHTYTQAGIYRVVISVIDNGRLAFPATDPAGLPAANDPIGALLAYTATQGANEAQHSRLDQDILLVQVLGSMTTIKSDFQLDFKNTNNDRFRGEFMPNIILETIASTDITLTVGTLAYPTFKTDGRGRFRGQGIAFDFNVRRKRLKVQINKRALAAAFGQTNTSIVNGNVDIPVNIIVAGTASPLSTTVRYVYNSQKDKKGQGREGVSFPVGN